MARSAGCRTGIYYVTIRDKVFLHGSNPFHTMSIFLGIDIGTSGTKTLAIDENGRNHASATETYLWYAPKPLWSEQERKIGGRPRSRSSAR